MNKLHFYGKGLLIRLLHERILVFGDLHLGYAEGASGLGNLISKHSFEQTKNEFKEILEATGNVDKIVLLGDIHHQFADTSQESKRYLDAILDFLLQKSKEVIITLGNHDAFLSRMTLDPRVLLCRAYEREGYLFFHGDKNLPEMQDKKTHTWILGHFHPAVRLKDNVSTESFKCYLIGKFQKKQVIFMPSFFGDIQGSDPREYPFHTPFKVKLDNYQVRVINKGVETLDFGSLKEL